MIEKTTPAPAATPSPDETPREEDDIERATHAAEQAALATLVRKLYGAVVEAVVTNDGKVLSFVLRTGDGEQMVVRALPEGGITVKSRSAS